jgi:hypothetical protein
MSLVKATWGVSMRIFFLLFFSVSVLAQNNLLDNGDFELWQDGHAQGWYFVESTDQISAIQEMDTMYSGEAACKIIFTTQDQAITDYLHNIIAVTPGQCYTLDTRVFEEDSSGRARFVIYWYDADTVLISRQYLGAYSKDLPAWQQINKELIAIENARYAAVGFRFYDSADAWDGDCVIIIDSVSVSLTATSPPEILNLSQPYFPADTQLVLRAQITDDIGLDSILVTYFFNSDSSVVHAMVMDSVEENIWQSILPGQNNATPFSYRFQVTDKDTVKHKTFSQFFKVLIGLTPIQIAGTVDDNGCICFEGYHVCVTGVVTAASGTFAQDQHNDYLQDNTGAINIYSVESDGLMRSLSLCDSIKVWGELYQYAGRGELLPDSIVVLKINAKEKLPISLLGSDIDEDYEGCLVKLASGQLHNWVSQADTSFYAQLETLTGIFQLYINHYTDIDGMANPGVIDSLMGIVSQYDMEIPFSEGYFIMPRSRNDIYFSAITPVEQVGPSLSFQLYPNFPNPFNPCTKITYQLPSTSNVELGVYNLLGQKVATLVSGKKKAGQHQIEFKSHNLPSGIYFYRLQSDLGYSKTRKMILCK